MCIRDRPDIIGIVVNERGMERALATPGVSTIGYPYSISAYFRRSNANMTRSESRRLVEQLKKATKDAGRGLVIYISMAFGLSLIHIFTRHSRVVLWTRHAGAEDDDASLALWRRKFLLRLRDGCNREACEHSDNCNESRELFH